MPKNYFRFKQFAVKQDKCAMKVCTDACLFGAWVAHHSPITMHHSLDIGTGTGLLSLMLAQKLNAANIDAVEIDKAAAEQAKANFDSSPWKERLNIFNTPIQQFATLPTHQSKYNLIISNPPFYENDLKSDNKHRNLALHSAELKLEELINTGYTLLNDKGNFFVLIPYHRTEYFLKSMQSKFLIKEKVFIRQTPKHSYFRSMLCLTKKTVTAVHSEIIIMTEDGKYTNEFIALLKDYYLYL
jgi:tRNA1Val (adenine37-N6)-methyltransferase